MKGECQWSVLLLLLRTRRSMEKKNSSEHDLSKMAVYVNASLTISIVLISTMGNFTMIIMYMQFKKLRDMTNKAITILSASDLLRTCVVMTTKIYNQLSFVTLLADPLCTLTAFICGFTFVFSPLMLALIAAVRYCKVAPWKRLRFKITDCKFYRIAGVLVLTSAAFAVLPIVGITGEYAYSPSHGVCFSDWRYVNKIFRTILYFLVIGLALSTLIVCYALLFLALHQHNNTLRGQIEGNCKGERLKIQKVISYPKPNESSDCGEDEGIKKCRSVGHSPQIKIPLCNFFNNIKDSDSCKSSPKEENSGKNDNIGAETSEKNGNTRENRIHTRNERKWHPDCSQKNKKTEKKPKKNLSTPPAERDTMRRSTMAQKLFLKRISKQEARVTKVLMSILLAYCVCWIPAAILNAVAIYRQEKGAKEIPTIYFFFIDTVVELKCALNPIIYGLFNRKYRTACKIMTDRIRNVFLGAIL